MIHSLVFSLPLVGRVSIGFNACTDFFHRFEVVCFDAEVIRLHCWSSGTSSPGVQWSFFRLGAFEE